MEADISILRKTGHFYFALTRICPQSRPQRDRWFRKFIVDLEGFSKRPPVMEGSKRNYPNRGFTVEFKDDNVTASFEEVVRYNTQKHA